MLSTKLCLCAVAALALPASALQPGVPLGAAHSKPLFARGIASRTGIVTSPSVQRIQLTAAAAAKPPEGASVSASVVNLAKNIVGSGILALAAGVAAFSGAKVQMSRTAQNKRAATQCRAAADKEAGPRGRGGKGGGTFEA